MSQTASLYLLRIHDLQSLVDDLRVQNGKKKTLIPWSKKNADRFETKLEKLAVEKVNYRWSGMAFTVLAVFSRERLKVDWDTLEYGSVANELSRNRDTGIYIFSAKDEALLALKHNGQFYTTRELDNYAEKFTGEKPRNTDVMKDAVILLNSMLSKITPDNVVILSIV